jgi:hypothetical protein
MNLPVLLTWCVVLLIPAVPVFLIYLFFGSQNYFELRDISRGIVATGPIAAYAAMVWLGYSLYARVSRLHMPEDPLAKAVQGDWKFTSTSAVHQRERKGTCHISYDRGALSLSGTFLDGDKPVGEWESEMASVKGRRISFIYDLTELQEDGKHRDFDGICRLTANSDDPEQMEGFWVIAGADYHSGSIVYERVK